MPKLLIKKNIAILAQYCVILSKLRRKFFIKKFKPGKQYLYRGMSM